NYTFAVIKGKESYHLMKEELAPVLVEVNQIIQRGYLIIKGKRIEINLLLGGDYKVWKCDGRRGKESFDWTTLRGNDKKILLTKLPCKLPHLLPRKGNEVMKLWEGYQKSNVTPYIHFLHKHVPKMIARHNGIKRFTGQGVEKNNDNARRHYQSSNHFDPPKEVLLTEKRLSKLSHTARSKRPYEKADIEYWNNGILVKRARTVSE
uniref:Uncharacterized protein n=1 Tax=Amphimedon queenslandica TaxID=400682 RepID=A0A1X7T8W8_AMPQE